MLFIRLRERPLNNSRLLYSRNLPALKAKPLWLLVTVIIVESFDYFFAILQFSELKVSRKYSLSFSPKPEDIQSTLIHSNEKPDVRSWNHKMLTFSL